MLGDVPWTHVLRRIPARAAREGLGGLRMSGIRWALGSAMEGKPVHGFHRCGSGAPRCWMYRCRESSTILPGVLVPRKTAWQGFLAIRPAVRHVSRR